MNRYFALGAAIAGGVVAGLAMAQAGRRRLGPALGDRMMHRMGQVLDSLPANSPPKIIMSTLPRLAEQNEQVIALLREQNALLRHETLVELSAP